MARPEVSWSHHSQRAEVRRGARRVPSVSPQAVSWSERLWSERLPPALSWSATSQEPSRARQAAFPVRVLRRQEASPCARRPEASLGRRQAVSLLQPEVLWELPSAAVSVSRAQAVPSSQEARSSQEEAEGSGARAAQSWAEPAEPVASVLPSGAEKAAFDAQAVSLRAAGAVLHAQEEPQRAEAAVPRAQEAVLLRAAEAVPHVQEEVPQQEEVSGVAAEPRPVAARARSEASQRAERPSAAASVFRRARVLPSPLEQRQVEHSARARFVSQAGPPSERSWQAARCEGLS